MLDETGESSWNWKQNTMITINRNTGKVAFNGEYYVMRHFSQFVKPGARRILTTGLWDDKIAFINPDHSIVAVIGNSANQPLPIVLDIAGGPDSGTINATLPASSINTFIVTPQ